MSSSPEQQDFIGIHIRVLGTWTSKLYDFVEERTQAQKNIDMAGKKLKLESTRNSTAAKAKEITEGKEETAVTIESHIRNMDVNDKKLEVCKVSIDCIQCDTSICYCRFSLMVHMVPLPCTSSKLSMQF